MQVVELCVRPAGTSGHALRPETSLRGHPELEASASALSRKSSMLYPLQLALARRPQQQQQQYGIFAADDGDDECECEQGQGQGRVLGPRGAGKGAGPMALRAGGTGHTGCRNLRVDIRAQHLQFAFYGQYHANKVSKTPILVLFLELIPAVPGHADVLPPLVRTMYNLDQRPHSRLCGLILSSSHGSSLVLNPAPSRVPPRVSVSPPSSGPRSSFSTASSPGTQPSPSSMDLSRPMSSSTCPS